ncbi:glutathione peroxidase [Marininema mesophilum]|uniref:Glutathione peroxidase n=1 Tax=Marininema mesophilum TaxID=1048340 RepID=A0A1H3BLT1_9BACL|nr:glutathione peroxidase [Marininema mesophilum]SDX42910.1 glutathione peroxidase [Marininema mesophilum]
MNVYDFDAVTITGGKKPLAEYEGRVLLIVNTASKCGFTPQYEELQKLYGQYRDQGFEILGFPSNQFMKQEPGTNEDIQSFCKVNYGVTFPMFAKTDVRGETAHPLFRYLCKQAPSLIREGIKWNFTKFLVGRDGKVIKRFAPTTKPSTLGKDIKKALSN